MGLNDDWTVPRRARQCAISGQAFAAGDRVVSELFDRGDEFERRDRLESAEPGPEDPGPFSRWVSTWPPDPVRAPGVDLDLALSFLRDLLRDAEERHEPLAHVLALLLIRKKRFRVAGRGLTDAGRPAIRVTPHDDPEDVLEIPAPDMPPETVAAVSGQVAFLFGFGPDPDAPVEEASDEDDVELPGEDDSAGEPRDSGASSPPA